MIFEFINGVLIFGLFLVASIIAHEYGHYRMADKLGLKPVFKRSGYKFITTTTIDGDVKQQLKVLENGFLFGVMPLLVLFLIFEWYAFILIPLYLWGSRSDIRKWFKLRFQQ